MTMNRQELVKQIKEKRSFLCVGLDSDIKKLPACLKDSDDAIFEFNKAIIDATAPYTVAYKPNLAFYEAFGVKGWISFEKTVKYIKEKYPEIFIIADAKRGDIGNTSALYARSFFEEMKVDSLTVAPYMLATSREWGSKENMMYVVGATQGKSFENVRRIVPEHFLLVPGVGAQGGSLEEVCKYGMNSDCGLLVNASRAIIFADSSENFAAVAAEKARDYQQQMERELKVRNII